VTSFSNFATLLKEVTYAARVALICASSVSDFLARFRLKHGII
jgi:hypothetical protein